MCGIAGIVGAKNDFSSEEQIRRMTCALARRGPNGEGVEVWEHAALGHRRLAIFDLSAAGAQPMLAPDRSVGVVFNGAIYNFLRLRADLEARGYQFKSNTDTEVLIHGYKEWGIDALVAKLEGMFAIGLWDERAQKLYLVRDRLGVKPLVYAFKDNQLAFASTVRALRDGNFVGELDEDAMAEYLHFGYVTDERTIYDGVNKVPAATIVEWSLNDNAPRAHVYWSPPSAAQDSPQKFDDAVKRTEELLLAAVEKRLQADVPVGALLSGGVDSSLVCWAIGRLGGDVMAYTIGVPNDPTDESADARETARQLGVAHRVLDLSSDELPDVQEMIAAYAEPFACASALGMLRLSRAVSAEATVLLTGDGGDDVFLGYPEHRHLLLAEKVARATPDSLARVAQEIQPYMPRTGALKRASSFLNYVSGGLSAVTRTQDGLPFYQQHGILGERLFDAKISYREMPLKAGAGRHVLTDFLAYDRRTRFVGEFLPKVDGATMHYALEARSPFLDQSLWEYAASLPYELRLHRWKSKAILRELAQRKIGPRVAHGKKRGFSIPVGRWLVGRWRAGFEEMLHGSVLGAERWINPMAVLKELERSAQQGTAPMQLWYLYVLEMWMRREQKERSSALSTVDDFSATMVGAQ